MIKKAFSLIELVISIVVIGIVSVSFPLILSQTSNNIAFAMQQEAILETKTYMGIILSYQWDANSLFYDGIDRDIITLNVTTGNSKLKAIPAIAGSNVTYRSGHIVGVLRRKMKLDSAGMAISPCVASCDEPSVSSFNDDDAVQNLVVIDGTKNMDSILRLSMKPTIDYVSDDPTNIDGNGYDNKNITFKFDFNGKADNPTNIKKITITTTNADDLDNKIVLRAYSSNIGEFQMISRGGY
ncbi:MAG: prepilin-type N-terminal cleavage/methylation domain-containing protein [Campylobacteraceae bacterium]|jgi:prepilin-type N-terminal cleavage/methylation domain-containing protein|nr:prepilin-type N-terminal cleavage/methylation domain-containing protein [Campylobacteraceae bacterium]